MQAQANNNQGIVNSWSLITFAKQHGSKMQVGSFANKETGEIFSSCIFGDEDSRVFVSFSSNLGELTPQIAADKDNLQVVELTSGTYHLCKKGQNTWKDVDLGL